MTAMNLADFVRMWRRPRMIAWMLAVAFGLLLVRGLFIGVQPIPGLAELHPGFALVPVAGIYCGPAGVLGVMLAAWAGDWLFGEGGAWTLWRVAGAGVTAALAERLWRTGSGRDPWLEPRALRRLLWLGIPAGCGFASWLALGGSLSGMYPFGYLYGVSLVSVLWFYPLFAPALFHVVARHWLPAFGDWRTELGRSGPVLPPPRAAVAAAWAGSLSAGPVGILMGAWVYHHSLLEIPLPGTRDGWGVWLPVGICLAVAAAGLAGRRRAKSPPRPTPAAGLMGRSYLPPIERR